MKTVYHPTIRNHSRDVPDRDVDQWTAQGWRKTPLPDQKNTTTTTTTREG